MAVSAELHNALMAWLRMAGDREIARQRLACADQGYREMSVAAEAAERQVKRCAGVGPQRQERFVKLDEHRIFRIMWHNDANLSIQLIVPEEA